MRLRSLLLFTVAVFVLLYLLFVSGLIIGNGLACGIVGCQY